MEEKLELSVATQWFQNGDHPHDYDKDMDGIVDGRVQTISAEQRRGERWEGEVVRYYRVPDGTHWCPICSAAMHNHGWIDEGHKGVVVCPGDYVVTAKDGTHYTLSPEAFKYLPTVVLESKKWVHPV